MEKECQKQNAMKKIVLLLLLLPAALSMQAQENTPVPTAFADMITRLKVMHYLDDAALTYFLNGLQGDVAGYYKAVLKDNPVKGFDIDKYLGFSETPADAPAFINAVAEKNAAALLDIMEQYGYPSFSRLKAFVPNSKSLSAAIFIDRAPEEYKKKFRQALRDQYKEGNMTKREYAICMRFAKSDAIYVSDDLSAPVMVAGVKE